MDESNEIFMPYSFISLQVYHLLSSSVRLPSTNEMSNANAMRFIRKNFFTRQMISGAHFNAWHNTYTKWGREKENEWMNEWMKLSIILNFRVEIEKAMSLACTSLCRSYALKIVYIFESYDHRVIDRALVANHSIYCISSNESLTFHSNGWLNRALEQLKQSVKSHKCTMQRCIQAYLSHSLAQPNPKHV